MPSKKNATKTETSAIDTTKDAPAPEVTSPKPTKHRRASSTVADVYKPDELRQYLGDDKDLKVTKEIAKLNWKMNTSPGSLDEANAMKSVPISDPKVKKLNVFFSTGLHVTARASSTTTGKTLGVTVMDVLTAIHKQMKKKADDELELPVLANIEWGRGDDLKTVGGEDWPAVVLVTQKKEVPITNKKSKK
ncbi:hypothetical protein EDC01DRAFT_678378 [Geopyxis carbonaria]|nr:hypothetical protein EDC01DRAFT_678378 [Geopyxis carbonaria]